MHSLITKKHSVIVMNACSGDCIVMHVIDINQKERSGLLKSISIALKAENGYFLLLIENIVFYYTPRELVRMGTGKSQKVDHHTMVTQDIGTIAIKREFRQQDRIHIFDRTANVNGLKDPVLLVM